jgi:hypothetical protein
LKFHLGKGSILEGQLIVPKSQVVLEEGESACNFASFIPRYDRAVRCIEEEDSEGLIELLLLLEEVGSICFHPFPKDSENVVLLGAEQENNRERRTVQVVEHICVEVIFLVD